MPSCAVCGDSFTSRRKTQRFCSSKCFGQTAKRQAVADKFWRRVSKGSGCWLWTGTKSNGYGKLRHGPANLFSHRVSWQLHFGDIPNGRWVLHKCDNPTCVRPDHLFLGTALDNNADMASKGRSAGGEAHHWAKLTETEVASIRSLWAARKHTQRTLAKMFHVTHQHIFKIIHRQIWCRI